MSDEEEVVSGSEEEAPVKDSGPSEAEVAMLKRRAQQQYGDLDEAAQELLAANKVEQESMAREITEMRARREKRIKERAEEEQRMAKKRAEEEAKRKAEEEERKKKKEEEDSKRREERAKKMAELDKLKNAQEGTRNFQITKRGDSHQEPSADEESSGLPKKSKEELEAEKKAILAQRIQPLEISGFDAGKLAEKAKELHSQVFRLEGDKYDLEKRFKAQQRDMMELADKARQINKVGKEGTIKRVQVGDDEIDKIQERFAGAPAKVVMFSEYERQKDKRSYGDKKNLFKGPVYGFPAERIKPHRVLQWDDSTGQPFWAPLDGAEQPVDAEEEE